MEYQTITITVKDVVNKTTHEVQAQEAIGTGLAYHQSLPADRDSIAIASLNCKNMEVGCSCRNERIAQIYLEEMAKMTDWTADQKTIWADLHSKFGDHKGIVMVDVQAHLRSEKAYLAEQQEVSA